MHLVVKFSVQIFSAGQGFMLVFRGHSGVPLNSAFAVRPKSESSGLEVEAKLDFQY